jgi:hypothetical protein
MLVGQSCGNPQERRQLRVGFKGHINKFKSMGNCVALGFKTGEGAILLRIAFGSM